jgi:hypothetical protein
VDTTDWELKTRPKSASSRVQDQVQVLTWRPARDEREAPLASAPAAEAFPPDLPPTLPPFPLPDMIDVKLKVFENCELEVARGRGEVQERVAPNIIHRQKFI